MTLASTRGYINMKICKECSSFQAILWTTVKNRRIAVGLCEEERSDKYKVMISEDRPKCVCSTRIVHVG